MILEVENISKSFGERKLFENLSLSLEKGKIYTLMGANGSGKTTLFNILTGFINVDSGRIIFNNVALTSKSPKEINKLGISRTFQDLRVIHGLSVKENVLMVMEKKMFHVATFEEFNKVDEILQNVSLLDHASYLAGDLSYGQQKLLTLGCCLANDPKLLLLDEPIAGIDEKNKIIIKGIIQKLKNNGITILQIEHDLEYIAETSDLIFQLEHREIKAIQMTNKS